MTSTPHVSAWEFKIQKERYPKSLWTHFLSQLYHNSTHPKQLRKLYLLQRVKETQYLLEPLRRHCSFWCCKDLAFWLYLATYLFIQFIIHLPILHHILGPVLGCLGAFSNIPHQQVLLSVSPRHPSHGGVRSALPSLPQSTSFDLQGPFRFSRGHLDKIEKEGEN